MKITKFALAFALCLSLHARAADTPLLTSAARNAVASDASLSAPAIATLRAEGPAGLQTLLDAHTDLLQLAADTAGTLPPDQQPAWDRLRAALDAVSAQRDCQASHLFWYTDLDQAQAAAKTAGKPILSLRLLGKLDEEYSCANSRFFRATLYANTEVAQYLRDHFILHWKSVRPVPRITIDFGDGRKIERTITGNSIHYILDADGAVIDALPGLYGPKAFLKGLADAQQAAVKSATLAVTERRDFLLKYHADRHAAILGALQTDLAVLARENPVAADLTQPVRMDPPTAQMASKAALFSKTNVERPMLNSFQKPDDETWAKLATLHREDAALDVSSTVLMRSKYPDAIAASRPTVSKMAVEDPFNSAMRNLQRSIAEDTVRNEYDLHLKIHEWFANGLAPVQLDRLNSKIYAELFLTPESDPWLGLVPANTFSALDGNGLVTKTPTP